MNYEFHGAGNDSADLVHVHRGDLIEAIHRGTVVVVENENVVFSAGDPGLVTYYRSTAKLFQALPVLTSGAAEKFGLDEREIAIAAGSHNAEPEQLEVVLAILRKAEVPESALQCGGHWSINTRIAREQVERVGADCKPLPALWSNCSGKHAGMLAAARAMDAPIEGYLDPRHPVQIDITRTIASFAGVDPLEVVMSVDGCGAPVHAVSVEQMALSLARFGAPAKMEATSLAAASLRLGQAISAHPDMIAGYKRFDTDLMQSASARVLSKSGAEGVQGVIVPERQLAIAVKVDDGQDRGYRQVIIELLRRHEVLSDEEATGLADRHGRAIKTHSGEEVGHLEVVV